MTNDSSKPLHQRRKSISAPLSSDLREEYGFRSISVRKGDKVRVMRGDFRGMEGEVTEIDTDSERITVEDVEIATTEEREVPLPIHPSNVKITDLELKDEMRQKIIERRGKEEIELPEVEPEETKEKGIEEEEALEEAVEEKEGELPEEEEAGVDREKGESEES